MLESYCQADVTVLREARRTFRKHFLQIGNVEVFLESMTIASVCSKVFCKKCLQPVRIGLIPVGGYTDYRKQSKKAIAWFLREEKKRGKRILHGRNGKERQLPELPGIRVDGLCEETRTSFRVQRVLLLRTYVHAVQRYAYRVRGRDPSREVREHHLSPGANSAGRIQHRGEMVVRI
jgi:hypothetical protein